MSEQSNPLKTVERFDLCAGCGLCEGVLGSRRVEVKLNGDGFLRPVLHDKLTREEATLLSSVCPGLDVRHPDSPELYDPVWGPVHSIHTAAAADKEVRQRGSSGGVLSAIQIHLLESGQVDFVVSTSAAPDNPLATEMNICRTREDVMRGAGSRYAPSAPLKHISRLLDAPGRFAFVGKPCDVAALRRLARHDPRVSRKITCLLSFMCAGIPSQLGSQRILEEMGTHGDELASFRYRGDGWPGLTKATLKDGSTRTMSYEESWGNILSHYVQWRCKLCPDGTGEFADVTCADAWHLTSDGKPDFSEQEGESFAMIRNHQGNRLFQECVASGALLLLGTSDPRQLQSVQFHQSYRRRTLISRYLAMALLFKRFPAFNGRYLLLAAGKIGLWPLCRAFIGSVRRGLRSK